uniref:Uncharacterized protein n=1 Tax=Anguilla anguilla TaxID=7936 RepID=A0A0E9V9W4_ANGAN
MSLEMLLTLRSNKHGKCSFKFNDFAYTAAKMPHTSCSSA